ncbi:hypothetical protein CFC21_031772 [Triticum aestivum]|uniref:protein-disulfide reductase n=2 Tax=Triticum aestivum TaxID=4565 RepID=A0A3B6DN70_WHEAT|nr:hypothetical protein CFC21_031772 [Triticum aestivum]
MAASSPTPGGGLGAILAAGDRDYLIRNSGEQVKISSIEGDTVAIYFSASWCPPCQRFTPKLIEAYKELTSHGKSFEVIFVSGDQDEEAFNAYFAKMPWLAVPFSDSEGRKSLDERFEVNGIPHLVFLDAKTGEVLTDEGVEFVSEYGIEAYPFTTERINELKEQEKAAKDNQTIHSVLATPNRNYVISNTGEKVPIVDLEGKYVGICFVVNGYPPVEEFTPVLAKIYAKLKEVGEKFEVVATLSSNIADIINEHGLDAWEGFPFNAEKLEILAEKAKAKAASQTLESLLVTGDVDFVIGKDGAKVPVAELVGKTVLLYFSAKWCGPCRAFLPTLVDVYNKIKEKNSDFEIVFISSDRDQSSFDDFFSGMPWLAIPLEDERKAYLKKKFKIRGIPSLVAIGPDGKTVNTDAKTSLAVHGADAFPFTSERIQELEKKIDEMAKGWPEKVKHELHEHELVLIRRPRPYGCDGCEEMGTSWSYNCAECDFDLHAKCALGEEKKGEEVNGQEHAAAPAGYVCEGDVCRKA